MAFVCVFLYVNDCDLCWIMEHLSLYSYACTFCTPSNGYWEDVEQMKYGLLCFQLNSDLYKWIPLVQFI